MHQDEFNTLNETWLTYAILFKYESLNFCFISQIVFNFNKYLLTDKFQ